MSMPLFSQTTAIEGYVFDKENNKPIPLAEITANNGKSGTTTGSNGFFRFEIDKKRTGTIFIKHVGYSDKRVELNKYDITKPLKIFLSPSVAFLNEVEIYGNLSNGNSYRTESVNIKKLKRGNITDLGDVLRDVPNVSGIRKGAAGIDPVIRGFKFNQLNVKINGASIEGGCPNRMDPPTAHLDLNNITSVKILKGPFALKYGTNFGGLILINRFQPHFYDKFENEIKISFGGQSNHTGEKTGVRISGGNRKIYYEISGNQFKYGNYTAGNGETIAAKANRLGSAGNIAVKLSKKSIIAFSSDISRGQNIDFPALSMDERLDDTRLFNLKYNYNNNRGTLQKIDINVYNSAVTHQMDNKNRPFSDTVTAISTIDALNRGANLSAEIKLPHIKIETGADFQHIEKEGERHKYLILQPGLPVKKEKIWNNASSDNIGLYILSQKRTENFFLTVSARIDYNQANSGILKKQNYQCTETGSNFINFSYSAGVKWQLSGKQQLNIAAGSGTRSPDLTERFILMLPVGSDPFDYLGNPQLKPETNYEFDAGYKQNLNSAGEFNFSLFFSYVKNFISSENVPPSEVKPSTPGVLGVKRFVNIKKAYLSGFEFSWHSPLQNRWSAQFNASYTAGINPDAFKPVIENGKVVREEYIGNDPLPEIPPFEVNFEFRYSFFNKRLIPRFFVKTVAAQNRISQAYIEKKTPGFTVMNFKLLYRYNKNLSLNFGVNNIFNTAYYEHLNRITVNNHAPLYEPGRLFYINANITL
jgi:iron complex outermembrane receptor protein